MIKVYLLEKSIKGPNSGTLLKDISKKIQYDVGGEKWRK